MKYLVVLVLLTSSLIVWGGEATRTSHADKVCIALNAYHEARGEGDIGMSAVTHVVMNRVESQRFPNSVCEVVFQYKQFSWTLIPSNLTLKGRSITEFMEIYSEVDRWLEERDPTNGSDHYHANTVNPYWAKGMEKEVTIGNHIFYRSR